MPRIKRGIEQESHEGNRKLETRLADELKNNRDSGQPLIDEQQFPTGMIRVNVIWDDWDGLQPEDRTAIILRAYEIAEGQESRERIALASGLTFPEAYAAGMLPFQIFPALRKGDAVDIKACHEAMMKEGASTLFSKELPQLRFATQEDADAAQQRLIRDLPNSEPVWIITREVGKVDDWYRR